MKSLKTFITEEGSSFSENVKYSKKDFNKWCDAAKGLYEFYDYKDSSLVLIYKKLRTSDKFGSSIDHVATYDKSTEILSTNDTSLFGH